MKDMHKIEELLCEELEERGRKGSFSANDLDVVYKLLDGIKNIYKIEIYKKTLEEEGGHSERRGNSRDGEWMARGEYGGSYDDGDSYARRKRDRMGRYSRDGGSYEGGGSYRGGSSYEGGSSSRRGYSRDGGKDELREMVDDMMGMATTERMREALHRLKAELDKE